MQHVCYFCSNLVHVLDLSGCVGFLILGRFEAGMHMFDQV